jgi:DNA-binding CsgD family transcriptional regulator
LPFRRNTFRFNFSAPFYENDAPLVFSYFLVGFSEDWSHWSGDSYKDFSNLWEGEYLLKLKAKNIFEVESEIATIRFSISPPWHRSNAAYLVYLLFVLIISFLFVKFIVYRIRQAKQKEVQGYKQKIQKQREQSQHEAIIAEKEIIKLRNDKLRAEKKHRDKELANQTMGLVQKNKLLINISEELQFIHNLIKSDSAKSKIYSLKKRIRKEIDNKQQNKIFETYFDEVHEDFFNRLKEKYPILSPNDLRLCAFIKMNISTKEIATILNISYRGAEISRYRLRKKLELSREINLSTFLSNI